MTREWLLKDNTASAETVMQMMFASMPRNMKEIYRAMVHTLPPVMQERGIFLGILTVCNVIMEGSACTPDIRPKDILSG